VKRKFQDEKMINKKAVPKYSGMVFLLIDRIEMKAIIRFG